MASYNTTVKKSTQRQDNPLHSKITTKNFMVGLQEFSFLTLSIHRLCCGVISIFKCTGSARDLPTERGVAASDSGTGEMAKNKVFAHHFTKFPPTEGLDASNRGTVAPSSPFLAPPLLIFISCEFSKSPRKGILELKIIEIGQFCGNRSLIKNRRMRQATTIIAFNFIIRDIPC